MQGRTTVMAVLTLVMAVASGSLAHSPVDPEDGTTLETATRVDDPAKSWAIYGHLDAAGDTWYFEMDLGTGDRLYLSLLSTEPDFVPTMVVSGPGLGQEGDLPPGVEVQSGHGWSVVEGDRTDAEFEPFTPGSYHHVAKVDREVTEAGTYNVAVHAREGGGPFSLAVGYVESFTLVEWLSLPVSLVGVYRWEGQSWAGVLGPAMVAIVAGLGVLVWHHRRREEAMSVFQWTSAVSGVFILSWAVIVVYQMALALSKSGWQPAAMVTVMFAVSSMAMGLYALLPAFRGPAVPDVGRRAGMVLVGVLALFLYSGLYVGPAMALVSGLLPGAMAGRGVPLAGRVGGTAVTRWPSRRWRRGSPGPSPGRGRSRPAT